MFCWRNKTSNPRVGCAAYLKQQPFDTKKEKNTAFVLIIDTITIGDPSLLCLILMYEWCNHLQLKNFKRRSKRVITTLLPSVPGLVFFVEINATFLKLLHENKCLTQTTKNFVEKAISWPNVCGWLPISKFTLIHPSANFEWNQCIPSNNIECKPISYPNDKN